MKKAIHMVLVVCCIIFICICTARYYGLQIGVKVTYNSGEQPCHTCQILRDLGGWTPARQLQLEHSTFNSSAATSSGSINHSLIATTHSTGLHTSHNNVVDKALSGPSTASSPEEVEHQNTPTLTRRGSDLNFNFSSCPNGSLMLENWKNQPSLHDDCPTLFIVGARKGGSTSLYHYMDKHPEFKTLKLKNLPIDGETFYFSKMYLEINWTDYVSRFPSEVMTGEASVDNLVVHDVPRRIFEYCGTQAKIVMLLRNPVSRFLSNFIMRARLGTYAWHPTSMNTSISNEVKSEIRSLRRRLVSATRSRYYSSPDDWNKYLGTFYSAQNMVYEGMYYIFVMNYFCNFPAENILIINSEEFFNNPPRVLTQMFNFLGLKQLGAKRLQRFTSRVFNKGARKLLPHQVLNIVDKVRLNHVYRPFNAALFKLLHWDADLWQSML